MFFALNVGANNDRYGGGIEHLLISISSLLSEPKQHIQVS